MNICVFSSSSNAIDDCYFKKAEALGQLMGERNHTLINGAGNVGLMQSTTTGIKKSNGKAIGIIPQKMMEYRLASSDLDEVIVTKDMQERKHKMREMSDAFIALPGGFGTLEEILEVITLRQLSYHHKPIVFINTNNFFDYLFKQFEVFYSQDFTKEIYRNLYFVTKDVNEAVNYIENYQPKELDKKWFKVPNK